MNSQPSDIRHQLTSQIISLMDQRQQLNQKVDQWNEGMVMSLLFAFLAAAAVLATTRMVILRSKQLSAVQDQLQTANDERSTADRLQLEHDLAVQRERTAIAEKALLQVQEKVRGREIAPDQIEKLKAMTLGLAKGVVTIQKLDQDQRLLNTRGNSPKRSKRPDGPRYSLPARPWEFE